VVGALALAAGADRIGALADGIGQDLLNVGILSVALAMLAWHCIWVSTHGHEMSRDAKQLGSSVRNGARAPRALMVAVALAVLREGAETVLFMAGLTSGSPAGVDGMLAGAGLGLAGGAAIGVMLYFGLSRVKPQHLFAVTNVLIVLLAAAIASQLARALAQSGLTQLWTATLWDTSSFLRPESALGVLLHALVGYDARPSGLQLFFYVATVLVISITTWQVQLRQQRSLPGAGRHSAAPAR
jgi:high-affinity iron transporter